MKLGIIGGSGLYDLEHIKDIKSVKVETPFGSPSDELVCGTIDGVELVFLPRHGKGHRILPGEINHRANIFALKKLGVTHVLSISAVGSLKKKYRPMDIVVVDQYFDRTKRSADHTFFGNGIVAHISMAEPVCPELFKTAFKAAKISLDEIFPGKKGKPAVHKGGTYLNMEGPAFSTKAESMVYRSWGMDVIGMTNLAEAKLAREAEMCYTTVAMVTDYDCWHPDHDHVTIDMIIKNFTTNVKVAKLMIAKMIPMMKSVKGKCKCGSALSAAIITSPDFVGNEFRKSMSPIIGKYLPAK